VRPARAPKPSGWFKRLRVTFLLIVLFIVASSTWLDHYRATRWRDPLYVSIYPIAADSSPVTNAYVGALDAERFRAIDEFFAREGARHRLKAAEPVRTRLRPELHELPPQRAPDAGILGTAWWSLRLRWWAARISSRNHDPEDVRMFVLYHDPALTPTVPHSLGLSKGLIGVVYAFATPRMDGGNDIVIAHELLHTLGAGDEYDFATDAPRFPDGYGDPRQVPLYPQRTMELMAGRRMLAADRWEQGEDLNEVVIGDASAREINWPVAPPGP
jgi:hypothetical protein